MNIKFRVELSQSERDQLDALLSGGRHATRKIKRAQILVAANDGLSDEVIAATLKVSGSTIYRTKRRFVEANLEGALSEEPRPGVARKLSSISGTFGALPGSIDRVERCDCLKVWAGNCGATRTSQRQLDFQSRH
jgi:Homeodomain-like domain